MTDSFLQQRKNTLRVTLQRLGTLGVCDGLSVKRQIWLANKVFVISFHHKLWTEESKPHEKRIRTWFKRGPGQLRRLSQKVEKVRSAHADLEEYVSSIAGGAHDTTGNLYLKRVLDEIGLAEELAKIRASLKSLKVPSSALIDDPPWLKTGASDPTQEATRVLAEFFTGVCHLSGKEAEVRVAKIGNAFWDWNVNLRERYQGEDDWKGSDAVRKRIKRAQGRRSSTPRDSGKRSRR